MLLQQLGNDSIRPQDILFLDDIGQNLKAAKALGFNTLLVNEENRSQIINKLEQIIIQRQQQQQISPRKARL